MKCYGMIFKIVGGLRMNFYNMCKSPSLPLTPQPWHFRVLTRRKSGPRTKTKRTHHGRDAPRLTWATKGRCALFATPTWHPEMQRGVFTCTSKADFRAGDSTTERKKGYGFSTANKNTRKNVFYKSKRNDSQKFQSCFHLFFDFPFTKLMHC